eukprot:CAMPEP_0201093814 /NCGR_PEP_ID=MMETSP0812-20130820/2244_1 /ASSEMBLY_ACC=CAM_ASM_000668 /TAXON_ID=98059 /ORGANISM="Dinobryon sp., Strain UTEXLB2267" /LENGTH=1238 /DNA_ID=CAMNT_0047346135 /DNA_START=28 /DNA_END=3744 /DNA_ORIENTATION=+
MSGTPYSYIVTAQKPTAVNYSMVCNFTGSDDEESQDLIVFKGNCIEVFNLKNDKLQVFESLPLTGMVRSTGYYRPHAQKRDVLLVLTEGEYYCVLSYDTTLKKIVSKAIGNVKDKVLREIETGQKVVIDPDDRLVGMLLYDGQLKVIPIEANGLRDPFNLSLDETKIIDLKFLYGCMRPTLCMLFEDTKRQRFIRTLTIDTRELEFIPGPWSQQAVDCGANMIIPVPLPLGGVIVIASTTLSYYAGTSEMVYCVEVQYTQTLCFARINREGTRYLLGDCRGVLIVLVLTVDVQQPGKVSGIIIDYLGVTSAPETISYLGDGFVFIGSVFGDNQLIKLLDEKNDQGSSFEVVEVFPNIGPIVDMCLVESNRGGQGQLVTCSGAYKDGSLRIVRNGIGLHEQASLDVSGIKGIWSIRASSSSLFDKFLIQSFIGESRILAMEADELSEIEMEGFEGLLSSLFCGNMLHDSFVQVTDRSVRLIDTVTFALLSEFVPERPITVASGDVHTIVIACSGCEVISLNVDPASRAIKKAASIVLDHDVACVSLGMLPSLPTGKMEVEGAESAVAWPVVALGMWTDNSIRLHELSSLHEVSRTSITGETQARDVLIVELESKYYLMVGLGDGHLLTYQMLSNPMIRVDDATHEAPTASMEVTLTDKRLCALGNLPVTFSFFRNSGEMCVLAACDRPTIIYSRNQKILFSVLNTSKSTKINGMTPFHAENFPDCLALTSESCLLIGNIEDIQKLHIQSIPLGEEPRRIAHSSKSSLYAVVTSKTVMTNGIEETMCRVLFLDDSSMELISSYDLELLETGFACTTVEFAADPLSSSASTSKEYFAISTGYIVNDEPDADRGRVLLFEVSSPVRKVDLAVERDFKAAVYSLAAVGGRLAAGVGSKVQVLNLRVMDDISQATYSSRPELLVECSHSGHILSLYLKVKGDLLLIGDLVRSMTVLQYHGGRLLELARDYNSNYMRAVEIMGTTEDHFFGSDDHGNLFSLRRNEAATSEDARSKLDPESEFHTGEFVNVMRRGSLVSQPAESDTAAAGGGRGLQKLPDASSSSTSGGEAAATPSSGFGDSDSIFKADYSTVTGLPPGSHSLLFGTVSGSIGCILGLSLDSYRFFRAIEKALQSLNLLPSRTGLSQQDWRSFRNELRCSPQRNAVDGDLVERVLDLDLASLSLLAREVNDELNNLPPSCSNVDSNAFPAAPSSTPGLIFKNIGTNKYQLSAEEIVRRIEDIARLH